MPGQLMRELKPDFGIAGEGEARFARLLDHLETNRPVCDGVYRWENGRLLEPPPVEDFVALDDLPTPDRSMLDPRYYAETGIDSVQTKRGCALKCAHCTYPRIEGRRVRLRGPARVVDELLRARAENPTIVHVFIVDAVFNIPASHAKAVCREMIRRGYDTPWTCHANPRGFDWELAELMVEAGCTGVEIGTDSGCNTGLERLGKGFTTNDVKAMHALCKSVGLRDCHTFMLATPGESVQQVEETLRFCSQLDPFAAIFMIWTDESAHDQHHSEIAKQARSLLAEQAAHHPRWIVPALEIRFDRRLFRALRRQGFTGPLWQHIDLRGVGLR
jgi:radical SAM superfamily enzyme YgiQ (UPF0313 family)